MKKRKLTQDQQQNKKPAGHANRVTPSPTAAATIVAEQEHTRMMGNTSTAKTVEQKHASMIRNASVVQAAEVEEVAKQEHTRIMHNTSAAEVTEVAEQERVGRVRKLSMATLCINIGQLRVNSEQNTTALGEDEPVGLFLDESDDESNGPGLMW